ncbi:hypothetical protein EW146_g6318 [Bondarzewia mesenterica]|uniref:Uncharacterized protein n=1 Tax=Bondarzewia mesenterica TaxID=1095465 RepID=A0A4S4LPY6_9AGAM|nr:hypothetical protein EW146_g6318 [Bondarzewia mesenterica]
MAGPSSISSFTPAAVASISSKSPSSRPRPRPRPAYKGAKATSDTTNIPTSDVTAPILTPPSEPALEPTIVVDIDTVPSTIPHESVAATADFSLDIAERAKMSRRVSKRPISYRDEVIDISSEDELAIKPSASKTKLQPKPRPVKRPKASHPNPADVSIAESEARTIPILSSSIPLPPSDPPLPSSAPRRSPEPRAERTVTPQLNPSSPMASPVQQRKRKRATPVEPKSGGATGGENDSMDIDLDSIRMPPPAVPPPFFAASSPSAVASDSRSDPPETVPSETSMKAGRNGKKETAKRPKRKAKKTAKKKDLVEVVIKSPVKKSVRASRAKSMVSNEMPDPVQASGAASTSHRASLSLRSADDSEILPIPDSEDEDELQFLPRKGKKPPASVGVRQASESRKAKGVVGDDGDDNKPAPVRKRPGKRKAVVVSDEENGEDDVPSAPSYQSLTKKIDERDAQAKGKGREQKEEAQKSRESAAKPQTKVKVKQSQPETPVRLKENVNPSSSNGSSALADEIKTAYPRTPSVSSKATPSSSTVHISRRSITIPRAGGVSDAIRRANSHPNSPFAASPSYVTCSPLFKTSKTALSGMAHLLTIRRTPPPPPPPAPKKKKTKKEEMLEEKWEMELEDSVDGWWSLTDEERKAWRKAKRDKEMGYIDD